MGKKIYFIVVLALGAIVTWYFVSNPKSTLGRSSQIGIEYPEAVTKIVLTASSELVLEQTGEDWMVNGSFFAQKSTVKSLISVLTNLEIQAPVSKTQSEKVLKMLEESGVKVQIYDNKRMVRQFIINNPVSSTKQTYVLPYRSKNVYLVRVPSYTGNIASFFLPDINYWRTRMVFDVEPQNISEVTVIQIHNPQQSFKVTNYNDGTFGLQAISSNDFNANYEVSQVVRYFAYFRAMEFEQVLYLEDKQVERLQNSGPEYDINLVTFDGSEINFKLYSKPTDMRILGTSDQFEKDVYRAIAQINNSDEFVIIQYYIFDPILKGIDYFYMPEN